MSGLNFPIDFEFRISTFSNDFVATDASGNTIAYVKQKMFKLKEDIMIYNDKSKSKMIYNIKADRWLDFSAAYNIMHADGQPIGKIVRKGWKSLWKSEYELIDQNEKLQFHIREENPMAKVMDGLLGEIPLVGAFTGYFFNPKYVVTDLEANDTIYARLSKQPSFWGRRFKLEKLNDLDIDDEQRIILGLMMMMLLERRRG